MKYALILILVLFSCQKSSNQLSLPNLFSDGMVMQRDTTISIWGTSDPSEPDWRVFDPYRGFDLWT